MGRILDRFGRPAAFFDAGNVTVRRERPLSYYSATRDTHDLLSTGSWQQTLSSGRFVFANVAVVRGALLEQASYSYPLEPVYVGADKDWGRAAADWLNEWLKVFCVRGGNYDWETYLRLLMLGVKVDGDFATIFTSKHGDTFPAVQMCRAHRLGDGKAINGKCEPGSRYAGMRICNGVITDAQGAAVAFRLLGDKVDRSEDQDLPAIGVELSFRPDYSDQDRGISHLVASIGNFADVKRLRDYEMRAQQVFASTTLLEKNETGMADMASAAVESPTAGTDVTGTASGLIMQTFESGLVRYFKAASGSGLEAFRGDRPTRDAQAWEDKIVAAALYGIEWDPNFALALKEPGGAYARVVVEKIRRAVLNNQKLPARAGRRIVSHGLAWAIRNKEVPMPRNGDWYSWEFLPAVARITADSGNEEAAKREAFKLGMRTLEDEAVEKGRWWIEGREQRTVEVRDLLERASAVQKDYPELSLQESVALFEQRSPNGAQGNVAAGQAEEESKAAPKEKE